MSSQSPEVAVLEENPLVSLWFPILAKRIDHEQPRIRRLRRYIEGDAPLPEMGPNLRAAWQRFQRKARTNWAELIVESAVDRVVPQGIQINGSADSVEANHVETIWRDNRMDVVLKTWLRDGIAYRDSYLCLWEEDGKAVITAESPETMYAATDPARPWIVRAALKAWRDRDVETDYAWVWVPGGRQMFSRPSYTGNGRRMHSRVQNGSWTVASEFEPIDGDIPIYVYRNPTGWGEFERDTDLIDRINHDVLQRLVTTSMQAYRQRALKRSADDPDNYEDESKDSEGNDVDLTKVFEPAPGALWDLPAGIDIWESQYTDITPMLTAEKADLRDLAAKTRTPLPMLLPDSANQSAEGAKSAQVGFYAKARNRCDVAKITLAAALLKAMRVEGVEPSGTIDVVMENPEYVTITEKYAAAMQAKQAGESWKSIERNILGYTPEQIQQDAKDRAGEQLAAAMLTGQVNASKPS